LLVFLEVFWEKWCAERGFWVVNLWWIAWSSWTTDGRDSAAKKWDTTLKFIFKGGGMGNA